MEMENAKHALSSQFHVLGTDPGRREVRQIGLTQTEADLPSTSPTSTSTAAITPSSTSTYLPPLPILDQIAPFETIRRIIDDWFSLIHSVCPIHHRANFLKRLGNGNLDHDPEFLAVVISLCCATVSSLPRKAAIDYPDVTVKRCFEIIQYHRLLDNYRSMSLQWCQAKYHLSTSFMTEESIISFRLLGEVTTGIKYLVNYELPNMSRLGAELAKRLHCLILCGLCTYSIYGRPNIGLISAQDNIQATKPLDMNDTELDPTNIDPSNLWHGDTVTYVPGLNYLTHLFYLWHSSQQTFPLSVPHIQQHMTYIQRALDTLPPELRWRGGLSRPPGSNFGTDVQTANLYITQLHIRSSLLEQMYTLSKSLPTSPALDGRIASQSPNLHKDEIRKQRAEIVKDLLEILYHMSEETLEANGHSLVPKVRDIGSALLDEMRVGDSQLNSGESDGSGAFSSQEASLDLRRLLEKLERLDFRPWDDGYQRRSFITSDTLRM
ncbi:hypothetical protein IFR04_005609 [Cadophora malorum]|uniref:Transcription factor domain-containing protein n=1 Tax=Cadophora malorum TaxID=108018 RepID=A0A8H7TL88_9HELO|nr:hypothetical protein IFR04_005609 [Cadophora malorum]